MNGDGDDLAMVVVVVKGGCSGAAAVSSVGAVGDNITTFMTALFCTLLLISL